jgi:hypothetical protein
MPENHQPLRIGLRVMQMRLTVIGFNKAIVSFQIAQLSKSADGLRVPEIDRAVHAVPELQLFLALGLSFLALMIFIMSGAFDKMGDCNYGLMLAGELLLFLMLANTLAGFFGPQATTIDTVADALPQKAPMKNILQLGVTFTGGAAWFLVTYIGPLVLLVRSHFKTRSRIAIGMAYLLVLLVFCWLIASTVRVQSAVSGDEPGYILSVLRELVQPLRW